MSERTPHAVTSEELQELLDGRLAPERRAGVEGHLEGCEACRGEIAALRGVKEALARTREEEATAPAALAEVLRQALDEADRGLARREDLGGAAAIDGPAAGPPQRPAPVRPLHLPGAEPASGEPIRWAAVAAGVALVAAFAAGVFWLATLVTAPSLPRAVTADFRLYVARRLPLELETSSPAALEEHLRVRGAPATRVFDFAMMDVHLIGGGAHQLARLPAALFAYRAADGGHVLCLMYRGRVPSGATEVRSHEGIDFHLFRGERETLVFWQEAEIACVLVSAGDPEEAVQLAFAKAVRV